MFLIYYNLTCIRKELPLKKTELDVKFNVDPQNSSIKIDEASVRET